MTSSVLTPLSQSVGTSVRWSIAAPCRAVERPAAILA